MRAFRLVGRGGTGWVLPVVLALSPRAWSVGTDLAHWTEPWDVVWTSPSQDASGSMPLGNGDVGVNLWVEPQGDLLFYISRGDSLSEVSRLLKVGRVRVSLSPHSFDRGSAFHQVLRLRDGVCEIALGEGETQVKLRVFVDADYPVVHVVGESAAPLTVKATVECWRTQRRAVADGEEQISAWTLQKAPFALFESADVFVDHLTDAVAWYHRNEESTAFVSTLKVQSLEAFADKVRDPLLHRTFGGYMIAPGFNAVAGHAIQSGAPVKSFTCRIASPCMQTASVQDWLAAARSTAVETADAVAAFDRTAAWWRKFWARSWIVTDAGRGLAVPENRHPLRIGYDSNTQNRFPGQIGRTSIFGRVLAAEEIARLASVGHEDPVPALEGLLMSGDGRPRDVRDTRLDFRNGMTLEAWVRLEQEAPGRIFDKMTAGGADGFLFDTHPGDTLRVIVGHTTLTAAPGIVRRGQWRHVAGAIDTATGAVRVYLDGKVVAERTGGSPIMRGYTLQRYVQACGGRGVYPIKFNGGMFTVEPKAMGKPHNPDWRAWGDCHWFQNVRHMYHPMLASGDFEMMRPFFEMYEAARPLAEARTRLYHGAEGCYFPETMTVWGTYSNNDYGWDRTGRQPKDVICPYWQYAWNQGPEIVALMLDRWDYTEDEAFLKSRVLPMAESVLQYFDTRFRKDANGRIVLSPTQSLETYWGGVTNDMPTVAGLTEVTARLCGLRDTLTTSRQGAFFARMKRACPAVPMEDVQEDGSTVRKLAPAQEYEPKRSNCENPELYAVWPFRLFGIGRPGLEEARAAYARRGNHLDCGWGYDGNCAALLGLTDEAARILAVKCANSNPNYRWPATWGPNFDWLPDQNHGGNLLETTQLMLLQADGDHIRLLPAWPKNWDVSFRLHAPRQAVVECVYRGGKIEKLVVTPESRRKNLILPEGSR